jgi:predicted DsbA family dithiol-disulfide isomerase
VEWRSFLLRPEPAARRSLEQFRAYTRAWTRPASEPDSGTFRVWEGEAGPPSHSIPPHLVSKAAAELGPEAFRAIHDCLLQAYFADSRDITDLETLRAIWREAGLPEDAFARHEDGALLEQVLSEHREALSAGVGGVPAARMAHNEAVLTGALPLEVYRRWIQRTLASA